MFRAPNCLIYLLPLLVLFSCKQPFKSEKEEVTYWGNLGVDSAYRKLYKDKDTTAALALFDATMRKAPFLTAYIKAERIGMITNYYYFFTNNNERTARLVDSAIGVFNTPTLRNRYARTYVGLLLFGGHMAYRLQLYNKANEYYFRAKKQAEAYLDPCEQKAFNYSIAMVLYKQKNFRGSLDYFTKAYQLQNTCTPQTFAVVLQQQEIQSNIGLCLVELGKYDSALVHFDKALQIANQYKDSLGSVFMEKIYGVAYGEQAQVYMAKNQLDLARQLCKKSIALNSRPGYEMENAQEVKLQLADIYDREERHDSMLLVLQDLRKELDTLPNPEVELGRCRLMSAYYEQTGHHELALSCFKNYISLRDSINEQQRKLSAADVAHQLDVKEKELEIVVLKKDNQIAMIFVLSAIGAALMVLLIMVLIYQNYKRNKKSLAVSLALNEEIRRQKAAREKEAKQRHKEITKAVISAQENERALIGLELHDNVNQVLTTVKLQLEMAQEGMGDPKLLLPRSSRHLQECINEIRSLSKRLSAPSLGKISLEESVNDLLDSVVFTKKVQISRRLTGIKNQMLQKDLHVGIYRILQEQLNNVLKHAEASEVFVELEGTPDLIRLYIYDNGKGFITGGKKEGIGLKNMQTRAENLNGSFELNSAPGAGCSVEVVVPRSKEPAVAKAMAGEEGIWDWELGIGDNIQ
jgi:signal transduction histidine kinase